LRARRRIITTVVLVLMRNIFERKEDGDCCKSNDEHCRRIRNIAGGNYEYFHRN
jgi:hypothetical protein